jgi:hypothetical protein
MGQTRSIDGREFREMFVAAARESVANTPNLLLELKESGPACIPSEVQNTLTKPECALKSWMGGTMGIIATNKRVFIRQGLVSRKVIELRYSDIKSIEHSRKYPWRTLLLGIAVSGFLLVAPALRPIFSRAFVAEIDTMGRAVTPFLPAWLTSDIVMLFLLPLLPLAISVVVFLFGARSGFSLYGVGFKPLHLPRRFKEAVGFIRDRIDWAAS